MKMQPISTAPTDGTPVLCFGSWAGEINGIDHKPGFYVARYSGHSDYFEHLWSIDGTDAYAAWCKPTHWAALPERPE